MLTEYVNMEHMKNAINVLGYLSFDLNTLKMFESVKTVVLFVLKLIYIMPVSVQNSFDIGISEFLVSDIYCSLLHCRFELFNANAYFPKREKS